ncbi:MAG: hypothetical protein ACRENP_21085 [Longimicrobiales bacterium]
MIEIREISPEELPAASEQDLMNLGLFRDPGSDLFLCVGPFADGRGQHRLGVELPGRCCAVGLGRERERRLPKEMRGRLQRARVRRASLGRLAGIESSPEAELVRLDQVSESDLVESIEPFMRLAGER